MRRVFHFLNYYFNTIFVLSICIILDIDLFQLFHLNYGILIQKKKVPKLKLNTKAINLCNLLSLQMILMIILQIKYTHLLRTFTMIILVNSLLYIFSKKFINIY
jgi:hypothetical protein